MKMKTLQFLLSVAAISISSCVSSAGEVVGRSSQDRPTWANGDAPDESSRWVMAVYKKTDVFRLELGIRQAQAEAVANSKRLMADRLRRELHKTAQETLGGGDAKAVASALDNAVAAQDSKLDIPDVRSRSTYHEEIRKETDSGPRISYDVYVLVEMPRQAFDEVLHTIAKNMAAGSDARLKKIGNELVRRLEGEATPNE